MRLTTKSRYAVTAILDLALNEGSRPVTLSAISEKQGISLSYLEQLFAALRAKGLVKGVRGPGGGYYLGRASNEITIADVICAVDEWVEFTRGSRESVAVEGRMNTTHGLWDDLSRQIYDFVAKISLKDLLKREKARTAAREGAKLAA